MWNLQRPTTFGDRYGSALEVSGDVPVQLCAQQSVLFGSPRARAALGDESCNTQQAPLGDNGLDTPPEPSAQIPVWALAQQLKFFGRPFHRSIRLQSPFTKTDSLTLKARAILDMTVKVGFLFPHSNFRQIAPWDAHLSCTLLLRKTPLPTEDANVVGERRMDGETFLFDTGFV